MLASTVIATIHQGLSPWPSIMRAEASSAWSLLMLSVGHPWASEKLFSSSQAAPRHEKLWGYLEHSLFPSNRLFHPKLGIQKLCFSFTAFFLGFGLELQAKRGFPFLCFSVNTSSPWVSKTTNNELCLVGSEATDGPSCNNTGLLLCTLPHTCPPASKLHRISCSPLDSLNAPLL